MHAHKVIKNEQSGKQPTGKLAFAYNTITTLEDNIQRILTAANCTTVDEVIQKLNNSISIEDLRNKLSPVTNLIALIELENIFDHSDKEVYRIACSEISKVTIPSYT